MQTSSGFADTKGAIFFFLDFASCIDLSLAFSVDGELEFLSVTDRFFVFLFSNWSFSSSRTFHIDTIICSKSLSCSLITSCWPAKSTQHGKRPSTILGRNASVVFRTAATQCAQVKPSPIWRASMRPTRGVANSTFTWAITLPNSSGVKSASNFAHSGSLTLLFIRS